MKGGKKKKTTKNHKIFLFSYIIVFGKIYLLALVFSYVCKAKDLKGMAK